MLFQMYDTPEKRELICSKCEEIMTVEGPANLVQQLIEQSGWVMEGEGWVCPKDHTV